MTFFEWVRTADVMQAANQRTRVRLTALIERLLSSRRGQVYRSAEPILRTLAEIGVAFEPRVHMWCGTATLLLASEASGAAPDPIQTQHLKVDDLAPERLCELHILQAAEALAAVVSRNGGALAIDIPFRPSSRFSAGRLGTFGLRHDGACKLEVVDQRVKLSGATLERLEVSRPIEVASLEIPVHDSVLCSAWLANAPVITSQAALAQFASGLGQALEDLAAWDSTLRAGCSSLVSCVLAAHRYGENFSSSTNQAALGLVHLPGITDAFDLADCLVHEAMHTKLYHVETLRPLFQPDSPSEERFYSPWRTDPRPLRMLLHGAYVFAAVAEYWAYRHSRTGDAAAAINTQQRCAQVLQAVATLQRHGRFTELGDRLVSAIAEHATATQGQVPLDHSIRSALEQESSDHRSSYAHYVA